MLKRVTENKYLQKKVNAEVEGGNTRERKKITYEKQTKKEFCPIYGGEKGKDRRSEGKCLPAMKLTTKINK